MIIATQYSLIGMYYATSLCVINFTIRYEIITDNHLKAHFGGPFLF
ncbi:hypothetical protein yrohd0001_1140 [Yersinia rohdei ATCC 43380]|nr:hypothetical protein yrohd0001_1140 [Yersinia rohdei ATCC 43380]